MSRKPFTENCFSQLPETPFLSTNKMQFKSSTPSKNMILSFNRLILTRKNKGMASPTLSSNISFNDEVRKKAMAMGIKMMKGVMVSFESKPKTKAITMSGK